tara:strand:- start:73 stop:603 length:531 start_codon:yes stop_codon:yes gene_type:complete
MLSLKKKEVFLLNKNLKIENLLNDIATSWTNSYYKGITKTSTDINGKKFAPLKESTVFMKKLKGYKNPKKPLLAEGKMRNTYVKTKATRSKQFAVISINNRDRKLASKAHNEGTKPYKITPKRKKNLSFPTKDGWINTKEVQHTGQKKREWYGIGKVQTKLASKEAKRHIKKALLK